MARRTLRRCTDVTGLWRIQCPCIRHIVSMAGGTTGGAGMVHGHRRPGRIPSVAIGASSISHRS